MMNHSDSTGPYPASIYKEAGIGQLRKQLADTCGLRPAA